MYYTTNLSTMQDIIWTILSGLETRARQLRTSGHQDPRFKFFWQNLGSFGVWLTGSRAGRWLLPLAADQYKWEN